jgi:tetratricopeptide (TPR) repeat protein
MAFGLLAASVAAAALLFFVLVPRGPETVLFTEIDVVPLVPPPAVRGGPSAEVWEEAGAAWEADDLAGVVRILSPALDESPTDDSLLFYLGVAHLRLGEHDRAVEILTRLDRLQADLRSENTRWYLAAALDGAGRRGEACAALQSVVDMDSTRSLEARRILRHGCPTVAPD